MKYSLVICLMVCGHLSFAETADREVYLVDGDNSENEQTDLPLFDRPENIIRLDREFPELVQSALNTNQNAPGDLSFLSSQSPLTAANNSISIADPDVGALTHFRPKTAHDFNPLQCPVKWQWDDTMTVGKAIQIVAKFMGFRLLIRDPLVGEVYSMPLPVVHQKVEHVDAKTALELLGGPGLMVVIDPASRTVLHRVRDKYLVTIEDREFLPPCIEDLTFAESPVGTETGVLIVEGEKCTF